MLTKTQIADIRTNFPILDKKTYLYNCSQGALSTAVEAGFADYLTSWRTSTAPWDEWMGVYERLRESFARFINAEPDEIAIINSASGGINPIASALQFDSRDGVVMSEYEFPTMGQIWLAQRSRGARVVFLKGVENAVPIEAYARAIDERTRIVPVTQLSFLNGFRSDVPAIAKLAHDKGAFVFLDGYQDCGTRPIDVKALGVDFFVTGTLKYMLGPPGLAFLYVRRELIETLTPTITSWFAQRNIFAFDTQHLDLAPAARRFENGAPPIPSIYGAGPALDLLTEIGMENVAEQVKQLARTFLDGARALGIATKTPSTSVGPLVVLRAKNPDAALAKLTERGVVVSTRMDGVRFAFHVYNDDTDVHTALNVLEEIRDLMVPA
ncbi:MAG TPA: aminotransferase class V-fold PLP-dependent enzyme [Gemmatimonadaceae bacterium]|nr:aminotransferase class V-fold PLP-dependent enzyme [Gemmatimonadaceae bacterium]